MRNSLKGLNVTYVAKGGSPLLNEQEVIKCKVPKGREAIRQGSLERRKITHLERYWLGHDLQGINPVTISIKINSTLILKDRAPLVLKIDTP